MILNMFLIAVAVSFGVKIAAENNESSNSTACKQSTNFTGICPGTTTAATWKDNGNKSSNNTPLAACHLACHNRRCRTICATALPSFGVDDIRQRRQKIKKKLVRRKERINDTENKLFEEKTNLFSNPNSVTGTPAFNVTPLTISETELEEELRNMERDTNKKSKKERNEQEDYDDESNLASGSGESGEDDAMPFTSTNGSLNELFTSHTDGNETTTQSLPNETSTVVFPTLLPQTSIEQVSSHSAISRQLTTISTLPPDILPPPLKTETTKLSSIAPPGFSPEAPGFQPDNEKEKANDNESENDHVKIESSKDYRSENDSKFKVTPSPSSSIICTNLKQVCRHKTKSSRKKKKLIITFSTEDFDDLEEADDDSDEEDDTTKPTKHKKIKPMRQGGSSRSLSTGFTTRQPNGCPPPEICGENCGIYVNKDGCQSCQCLWMSNPCKSDADCRSESQFCDLERCECKRGYEYDSFNSGVCRRVDDSHQRSKGKANVAPGRHIGAAQNEIMISSSANQLISGRSGRELPEERVQLRKVYNFIPFEARRRARRHADEPEKTQKRIRVRTTTTTFQPTTTIATLLTTAPLTTNKIRVVEHIMTTQPTTTTTIAMTTVMTTLQGTVDEQHYTQSTLYSNRNASSAVSTTPLKMLPTSSEPNMWMPGKPMREERLQWPGPCAIDGDCPQGLYCIASDCWALPEKPLYNTQDALNSLSEVDASTERAIWATTVATVSSPDNMSKDSIIISGTASSPAYTPPAVTTRAPAAIVADVESSTQRATINAVSRHSKIQESIMTTTSTIDENNMNIKEQNYKTNSTEEIAPISLSEITTTQLSFTTESSSENLLHHINLGNGRDINMDNSNEKNEYDNNENHNVIESGEINREHILKKVLSKKRTNYQESKNKTFSVSSPAAELRHVLPVETNHELTAVQSPVNLRLYHRKIFDDNREKSNMKAITNRHASVDIDDKRFKTVPKRGKKTMLLPTQQSNGDMNIENEIVEKVRQIEDSEVSDGKNYNSEKTQAGLAHVYKKKSDYDSVNEVTLEAQDNYRATSMESSREKESYGDKANHRASDKWIIPDKKGSKRERVQSRTFKVTNVFDADKSTANTKNNDFDQVDKRQEKIGYITKTGSLITKYDVESVVSKIKAAKNKFPMKIVVGNTADNSGDHSKASSFADQIDDYATSNSMRRPVRVQIRNAKRVLRDECSVNADCGGIGAPADPSRIEARAERLRRPAITYGRGKSLICCRKRWCDLSAECGTARFCLPDCRLSKLIYLAWATNNTRVDSDGLSPIDLIYD